MRPLKYLIRLEPDLEKFTFKGFVVIDVKCETRVDRIILNVKDLSIKECSILYRCEEDDCEYNIIEEKDELHVKLPRIIKGKAALKISYEGVINDLMIGFYRSKYTTSDGLEKYIAVTQFEEQEARRAFPCFDHPSMKAVFNIEMIVRSGLTALSNTEILEVEDLGEGRRLIRFTPTPLLSTYLVFFAVGEFEHVEDSSTTPTVRVITTPGKTVYGGYALKKARAALSFMEEYTGLDYPTGKCDYIAVQDFVFGAMENYGAITFRENLLLAYPNITTRSGLVRIASIIAHETAHLWFGDLVTPSDWSYLWLNESFATYFSYAALNNQHPEWEIWDRFILENTVDAFKRDSLINTHPIQLPSNLPVNINTSTAPIIYNKGAAVLRMLESYLGEADFQKAIKSFLRKYCYSNASTDDYWTLFEQVSKTPVRAFAENWIQQEGYPLIEAMAENNKIIFKQSRFTYLPGGFESKWIIPVEILLPLKKEFKLLKHVLKNFEESIETPSGTPVFKLNNNLKGFYRVKYDIEHLQALAGLSSKHVLPASDSFNLENDFHALTLRGDYSIGEYLYFLEKYFSEEDRYLPAVDIANNLLELNLVAPQHRLKIQSYGLKLCENILEKTGLQPTAGETPQLSELRNTMIWTATVLGSKKIREYCLKIFEKILENQQVQPDLYPVILKTGAYLNPAGENYIIRKLESHLTPEIEKTYLLNALGSLSDEKLLKEALDYTLRKIAKNNIFLVLASASRNLSAVNWLWDWFTEHIRELEKLPLTHLGRVIASITPVCGVEKTSRVKEFFNNYQSPENIEADTIKMALEQLKVYENLSKR